eukprot:1139807-Pelagomonas_calceolata.AAC.5
MSTSFKASSNLVAFQVSRPIGTFKGADKWLYLWLEAREEGPVRKCCVCEDSSEVQVLSILPGILYTPLSGCRGSRL